ncbi:MAG: methyltransferase [Verrucomicrobiota bacterium]
MSGPAAYQVPTDPPAQDPTPLFEYFRGSYQTELLVAALVEFRLFARLAGGPRTTDALRAEVGLQARPFHVLLTAVRAMGLVGPAGPDAWQLTELARAHLLEGSPYDVGAYFSRAAESPGARELVARLRSNRPRGSAEEERGVGFLFRDGLKSAMEEAEEARRFTLMLAGRAKNVAPVLAERLPLAGARRLLDVGGGTGIYALAFLRRNPELRAVVWDRPEVLKVAADYAAPSGVADRLELVAGDMFRDPVPAGADVLLLSNVLHDWDEAEARAIVRRCAAALPAGGRLLVHDVLLDDDGGGPLAAAMYSAHLFMVTEGRLYRGAEYRGWLETEGVAVTERIPTLVHASVLVGVKRG